MEILKKPEGIICLLRFDEDDEDKELVVDVEKEAHPCIAISEDNDGIQVSVLGLGNFDFPAKTSFILIIHHTQVETRTRVNCWRKPSPDWRSS